MYIAISICGRVD